MRSLIAEDVESEREIALLEAIETRIETKLTTMENEKHRQDAIKNVADDMERLADSIPEMPVETIAYLRTIALTFVDPLAEITTKANEEKKSIERETEEKLFEIPESEVELRQQIAIESMQRTEQIMAKRNVDNSAMIKKRDAEMFAAVPEQFKEKFKIFIDPDSAPDASTTTAAN